MTDTDINKCLLRLIYTACSRTWSRTLNLYVIKQLLQLRDDKQ